MKFGNQWIKEWEQEYGVSLPKPNKRYAIKKEDLVIRLEDYLKNIWRIRRYFLEKYGVDPPIINGDQMPLHRNESSRQKTTSFKGEDVFVKENYMLSRERFTVYTQVASEPSIKILPEFVFKGKGTKITLNPPADIKYQWSVSGSYRLEHMIKTVNNLPNRYNPFTQKDYAIYALDNYAVHLMSELRKALWNRGYILVILGGGITGFIQQNDTHIHRPLKRNYRDEEACLMLSKLQADKSTIPSPTRNEMMTMLVSAWNKVEVDTKAAFKSLFVTSALDGTEDYLVSDRLFHLIGEV